MFSSFERFAHGTLSTLEGLARSGESLVRSGRERLERREERLREALDLVVGPCHCTGEITYHSEFVPVTPIALGGRTMEEVRKCACASCGLLYDPDLPKFRIQVEAARVPAPERVDG